MAELGTYYITIMPDMSQFTGEVKSALKGVGADSGKSYSTSFLDVVKGSALGSALGGLASKAGSTIASGFSTGIKRLDTIKNFPRVMQSLGYSTADADKSIKTIMDHLDGLPTSTQDMVTLTQAISDSTGDLGLATDAALGFNDMMLANGASAAEMATAQGVLNRVLGKGSATVAQWQSLTSVMPAQLGMVARSMLGPTASTEDLHAALEDGTVSWNDFLQAIANLDKEGYIDEAGNKIASFEEQARANSDGIGTAIENIGNRVGKGWAAILDAIGQHEISSTIDSMSYGVADGMTRIADGVGYLRDKVADTKIGENLGKIGKAIQDYFESIDSKPLKDFADALVKLVDNGLQWVADNGDIVGSAISGIVGAIEALLALKLVGTLTTLPGLLTGLWAIIAANPIVAFVTVVGAAVAALEYFFTQTETGKAIWQGFCQSMSDLWAGLQADWQTLCGVLSREWESFQAFIDGIPAWWQGICDYWTNAMNQQAENFRVSGEKIKSDFANAWNAITTTVSTAATNIYTWVVEKLTALRDGAAAIWDNFKTTAHNTWESVKTTAATMADNMRATVVDKVTAVKDSALAIFDNIKNGIRDKIQWAKDQVSHIVDGIKNLFNFSWSLPAPKLPHINWHWEDIGGILSVPSFDGISWYAKGGVFDRATIIGIGEKDREAALPLNNKTYGEIARGIVNELGGAESGVIMTGNTFIVREEADIDRIAEAVSRMVARERGSAT